MEIYKQTRVIIYIYGQILPSDTCIWFQVSSNQKSMALFKENVKEK